MIPGSFCVSAKSVRTLAALLALCFFGSMAYAQTDNWMGTTGVWSDAANWDSGVPVTGNNIVIGTASANATDDFSLAIGTLTLSHAADTMTIADGVALNASSTIANSGTIQLSSLSSNTSL